VEGYVWVGWGCGGGGGVGVGAEPLGAYCSAENRRELN